MYRYNIIIKLCSGSELTGYLESLFYLTKLVHAV